MKVKNYSLLVFFFLLISYQLEAFQAAADSTKRKYKVVLDAGHGGRASGTVGKILLEKDIVLKVTLKVGKYLESLASDKIEVIYTRTKDVNVDFKDRTNLANEAGADLFVSIHANAMPAGNPGIFGTETYVMALKNEQKNYNVAKDDIAQRENSDILLEDNYQETYGDFNPESPEFDIILSIRQEAFQENSILFAQMVEDQFSQRAGRKSRGVKQKSLWVLWNTAMPAALVEIGYLSNAKEERELNTEKTQDYIASAIFRAIRDYFEYLDQIGN